MKLPAYLVSVGAVLFAVCAHSTPVNGARDPAATTPAGIYPLSGNDSSLPDNDLVPFAEIAANAQVLGLGEEAHASLGIALMKTRLAKYLIQQMGYRTIAMETPWMMAAPAESYVESCQGDTETALKSIYVLFQNSATLDLLKWMCAFNQAHPSDKVHLKGIDEEEPFLYSPYLRKLLSSYPLDPSGALRKELSSCVSGDATSGIEFYPIYSKILACGTSTNPSCVQPIPDSTNQSCVDALDGIQEALSNAKNILPSEERATAVMALIGLRAFQSEMYYTRAGQVADQYREQGMFEIFLHRQESAGVAVKTAFWAADNHVSQAPMAINQNQSIEVVGSLLRGHFGAGYQAVAVVAYQLQEYTPPGYPPVPELPTEPNPLETVLHNLGMPYLLLDLQGHFLPSNEKCSLRQGQMIIPSDHYRAVVFMEQSPAAAPQTAPEIEQGRPALTTFTSSITGASL